jgi:hypothetical protein
MWTAPARQLASLKQCKPRENAHQPHRTLLIQNKSLYAHMNNKKKTTVISLRTFLKMKLLKMNRKRVVAQ